jgi:hypothetical protein
MGMLLHTIKITKEANTYFGTAGVVQQHIEATLKDLGIPVNANFRVVDDADTGLIRAVRNAGLPSSPCSSHSLQRTVAVSLKGEDEVLPALKRVKNPVSGVQCSKFQAAICARHYWRPKACTGPEESDAVGCYS